VTGWPYYDDGGYIGLWFVSAEEAYADNFGGGSLGGQGKSAGEPGKEVGGETRALQPVSAWLKLHKGEQGGRKGMARQVNTRQGIIIARPLSRSLEFTAGETITITYAYDALYRLTAANYSDGTYFHYAYDSVGNRLTEQTQAGMTTYVYDTANRLTSVNGVTYTWDNNGNLLSDGVNTYTYDHANRLASASGGGYNATYGYNGTGDRLRQTVNGVTTSYTLDLVAGLTQVLEDGMETYLYGNGRIAQYDSEAQYFLGDALGSVRQMVNAAGQVNLAKGYQPYGSTQSSAGEAVTSYGFTGEWADNTGMIYLRARYYAPQTGRFTTRDTWGGIFSQPMSYNRWLYAYANPIVYSDPSGRSASLCIPLIGCVDTAKNAVIAARLAYSRVGPVVLAIAQDATGGQNLWRNRFNCLNLLWSKPETAIELLGDYFCERGPNPVSFGGRDALTQELAHSIPLDHVRKEYYDNPGTQYPIERKFNGEEYILAFLDSLVAGSIDNPEYPLTHFLGSFDYTVEKSVSDRIKITVTNRSDLASGTHIPGRFPPEDERENPLSVEQFIMENPELENEGTLDLLTNNPGIVSILEPVERSDTPFWMGGGNMLQTFTWSEKNLDCWVQKLPWPVYLLLLDLR